MFGCGTGAALTETVFVTIAPQPPLMQSMHALASRTGGPGAGISGFLRVKPKNFVCNDINENEEKNDQDFNLY